MLNTGYSLSKAYAFVFLAVLLSTRMYAQNVGIGTAVPNTGLDIVRDLALREAAAVTISAMNQINSGSSSHLRVTNTGTINEILNPQDGKVLYLINNSGGAVILANNAVMTANKIFTGSGADYSLPSGATAHLIYNATNQAWQLAGVSPGAGSSNAWLLLGNSGTNPAVNFLGTTDCQSLRFRVNNQFSGLIECATDDGNTAFGYNAMYKLSSVPSYSQRNVAMGDSVLNVLTTGDDNVGIGYRALARNTTGSTNTAVGSRALWSNNTNWNTAVGCEALYSTSTGDQNTAVGYRALYSNTTNAGVAVGSQALRDNTSGFMNTAVGTWALMRNTTGSYNTAVGAEALISNTIGYSNVALGYAPLEWNTSGSGNIAIGTKALKTNSTGDENVGIGYYSLWSNTTGSRNVGIGVWSLLSNTTGSHNTALGTSTLRFNVTGSYNVAVGCSVLHNNTIGSDNIAIGYQALWTSNTGSRNIAIGRASLYNNFGGWQNTAVGDSTGVIGHGIRNTYLGYGAGPHNSTFSNSTAIGALATVYASNSMMFGDVNVTNWSFGRLSVPTAGVALEVGTGPANGNSAYLTSGGVWTNTSDRNIKTNIMNLSGAEILAKIGQLPITRWTYKGTSETHIGPMAQDFYRLFNVGLDSVSISTVDPSGVALIGIQELKRQVESLQSENSALKKEIEHLRRENVAQQAAFESRLKLLETRSGLKAN